MVFRTMPSLHSGIDECTLKNSMAFFDFNIILLAVWLILGSLLDRRRAACVLI